MNLSTPRPRPRPLVNPSITSWEVTRSLVTERPSPVRGTLSRSPLPADPPRFTDPNTSEKAKQHAREVLEAEGEEVDTHPDHSPPASSQDQHTKRVLAGYKAALHSTLPIRSHSLYIFDLSALTDTNVSHEAKERAREILREHGEQL